MGLEGWDRGRGVSGCTVGETSLITVRCSQSSACLRPPVSPGGALGEDRAGKQRDLRSGKPMSILITEHGGDAELRGESQASSALQLAAFSGHPPAKYGCDAMHTPASCSP